MGYSRETEDTSNDVQAIEYASVKGDLFRRLTREIELLQNDVKRSSVSYANARSDLERAEIMRKKTMRFFGSADNSHGSWTRQIDITLLRLDNKTSGAEEGHHQQVLYHGKGKNADEKYFIKKYRGEKGYQSIVAESVFFSELLDQREQERARTSKFRPPKWNDYGKHLIERPHLLIWDPVLNIGFHVSTLRQRDAFDVFTASTVPLEIYISLWNDLGAAVAYLHGLGLYHGDIKLENLLYQSKGGICDNFYLTDCEYGNRIEKSDAGGTVNYASPQRMSSPPTPDPCCDAWSFVMTILAAWCSKLFQVTWGDVKKSEPSLALNPVCSKCRIAFLYTDYGWHDECGCACVDKAPQNQPGMNASLSRMLNRAFDKFAEDGLQYLIDTDIASVRSAVIALSQKMLQIDPVKRQGPACLGAIV